MPAKQNDIDLEPLLDAQQEHFAMTIAESSNNDAKALGIGAANVAVLIFIAQSNIAFSSGLIHAALLIPFLVSLSLNTMAILPWHYLGPGVDIDTSPEYLRMDKKTLVLQLLSNANRGIKVNDQLNKKRWRYNALSIVFSTIGTGILFVIL
jgi:hypothetical protein